MVITRQWTRIVTEDGEAAKSDSDRLDALVEEANGLIGTRQEWSGRILYTAVELGVLEILDGDPTPAADVASELDLDVDSTYRLLRAMDHFDVVVEGGDRDFSLTPVGELFLADHPRSVRQDLLFNRSPEWTAAMLHLSDVVEEGGPSGFVREFGCEFFEYVDANPEFGDVYHALIEYASRNHPEQILDALEEYDFSGISHVCDVGGGSGRLLCHLLEAHPHLHGTVLERPRVVAERDRHCASRLAVEDRCAYVAGDMFAEVPVADAYLLKWILHNFDDEACHRLLSTVHEAAPHDGRLFVVETVVPGPGTDQSAKRRDVTMMVQVGGRERTRDAYATMLDRTGWRLVETWEPEEGPLSVLEAEKA